MQNQCTHVLTVHKSALTCDSTRQTQVLGVSLAAVHGIAIFGFISYFASTLVGASVRWTAHSNSTAASSRPKTWSSSLAITVSHCLKPLPVGWSPFYFIQQYIAILIPLGKPRITQIFYRKLKAAGRRGKLFPVGIWLFFIGFKGKSERINLAMPFNEAFFVSNSNQHLVAWWHGCTTSFFLLFCFVCFLAYCILKSVLICCFITVLCTIKSHASANIPQ